MRSGQAESADLETRKDGEDAAKWKDPDGLRLANRSWRVDDAGFLRRCGRGTDGAGEPVLQQGEYVWISGCIFQRLQPYAAGRGGESQAAQLRRDLQQAVVS